MRIIITIYLARGGGGRPFENEDADYIADKLFINRRSANVISKIGTTFLVLDHCVDPHDLRNAIERNWWPALQEFNNDFNIRIIGKDIDLVPRPKTSRLLNSFVDAYEVATVQRQHLSDEQRMQNLRAPGKGKLGLVADLSGWSYPETLEQNSDDTSDRSLVALIRKPRMIVEYYPVGRESNLPIIRGVFVADDDIDGLLRKTEPKGHDQWDTTNNDSTPEEAVEIAIDIKKKITQRVSQFRNKLKPPPKPPGPGILPEWDRIMRSLLKGESAQIPPPSSKNRDFTIQDIYRAIQQCGEHSVSVLGGAKIRLREDYPYEECEVLIEVKYVLLEEGSRGSEVSLRVTLGDDSLVEGNPGRVYAGPMKKSDEISFTFESEPYSSVCSGKFMIHAEAYRRG